MPENGDESDIIGIEAENIEDENKSDHNSGPSEGPTKFVVNNNDGPDAVSPKVPRRSGLVRRARGSWWS